MEDRWAALHRVRFEGFTRVLSLVRFKGATHLRVHSEAYPV